MSDKQLRIVIAGAGVFGLSTALHLAKQGYTSITVLDPYPVPSQLSAANDINKIIRTEYHYPLYGGLAREAYEAWNNDSLFSQHFHKVGWFTGAAGDDERGQKVVAGIWKEINADGVATRAKQINGGADLQRIVPQTSGSKLLDKWVGLFNPEAGWAHSGNALQSVAEELRHRGVHFLHGPDGTFERVHSSMGNVDGVLTAGGRVVPADRVILAMGASTGERIGISDSVMRAYAYPLAMIQLSPKEALLYKDMPCLHSKTYGYIFEPSADGKLKFALPGRYAWYSEGKISRPEALAMSYGRLPEEARREMRHLLRVFLPQLANRPFCYEQLCWDADSYDDNFLVDFLPGSDDRVLLATGGSYHGFKFFPTIGRHVVAKLEHRLEAAAEESWAWRTGGEYQTRGQGETRVLEDAEARSARL